MTRAELIALLDEMEVGSDDELTFFTSSNHYLPSDPDARTLQQHGGIDAHGVYVKRVSLCG